MKQLAQAIKLATRYYEESWNGYKHTTAKEDAALKATTDLKMDPKASLIIYLLITFSWNEIQNWTELFKEE